MDPEIMVTGGEERNRRGVQIQFGFVVQQLLNLMIEAIVEIENGRYPFDELIVGGQTLLVQDTQVFPSLKELVDKKKQLLVKNKLIESGYLIRMLKIDQEGLSLHYFYEHVAHSLPRYIEQHFRQGEQHLMSMSAKLFLKKVTYQLARLISHLISMKLEIDLCLNNIGLTQDHTLKVFMNAKCPMRHQTELSLIAFYSSRKNQIVSYLESQLSQVKQPQKALNHHFSIKGNQTSLGGSQMKGSDNSVRLEASESGTAGTLSDSILFSNPLKQSTNSCFNLPKDKTPAFNARNTTQNLSNKLKAAMNMTSRKPLPSLDKGDKPHKNSFNFGNKQPRKGSVAAHDEDNSDIKSFTHSRSVRIELEQKPQQKNRKDSYKVKITTFHEYEVEDCDPSALLGNLPSNQEGLFEYFVQQGHTKSERKSGKYRAQEQYERGGHPTTYPNTYPTTPKSAFMRKEGKDEWEQRQSTATTARTLGEKVQLAKQKAESVLSRYRTNKKKSVASVSQDIDALFQQE